MRPTLQKGKTQVIRVPEHITARKTDPKVQQANGLKQYGQASLIIPNLYLGSVFNARDSAFLSDSGITHIINVAIEMEIQEQENIESKKMLILDEPKEGTSKDDYLDSFVQVSKYISKKNTTS